MCLVNDRRYLSVVCAAGDEPFVTFTSFSSPLLSVGDEKYEKKEEAEVGGEGVKETADESNKSKRRRLTSKHLTTANCPDVARAGRCFVDFNLFRFYLLNS